MTRTKAATSHATRTSALQLLAWSRACAALSIAITFACAAHPAAAWASDARISSITFSTDGHVVYGRTNGKRVRLLRACPREVFFGSDGGSTAPSISPNGRYVILERLFPYQAHGRVDESTVLLDTQTGRSYASSYYGRRFATGNPISTTWIRGRPATLDVEGGDRTRRIALPGPLANGAAPDRCAPL